MKHHCTKCRVEVLLDHGGRCPWCDRRAKPSPKLDPPSTDPRIELPALLTSRTIQLEAHQ